MYLDPKLIKVSTLCLGVILLLTGIQCSKSSLGFFELVSLTGTLLCNPCSFPALFPKQTPRDASQL